MFNAQYWKEKEERKKIKEAKEVDPSKVLAFMNGLFARSEKPKPLGVHTRSMKERVARRLRHANRMRNSGH